MMKSYLKRGLCLLMSIVMLCGLLTTGMFVTTAKAEGAITNPDAVIDIVVNIPADYPGTFLDFKDELTQKLIEQGLDASKFRILSSAIKIDTTNTSGWYVYDHYNSQSDYNRLHLNAAKQPFRQADNYAASGPNPTTIEKEFANTVPKSCMFFERHISSSVDKAGKAKMIFAGYGSQALLDYMIYPAPSDSRRTFSFDMDAKVIDTHTLTGTGFFINSGIQGSGNSATLSGYLLFYQFSSASSGNIYLIPINNLNAFNLQTSDITSLYGQAIATDTFSLNSTNKARVDVDLQSDKVTIQQRNYTPEGTFEDTKTLFQGKAVPLNPTGYNGFGPMAAYGSHSCSSLSSFEFSDLEMSYEASAFDALKNLQYSEEAQYKYFVNLAGNSGDPSVPEHEGAYLEGITRLNKNNIFYISNVDDGKILKNPTADSSGIGPDNGLYATDADYVGQMAEYIANNYKNNVTYKPVEFQQKKDKPIADFVIVDNANQKNQILTIHLQHLLTTGGQVVIRLQDKSMKADSGAAINGWKMKVYDTDNNVVVDTNSFYSSPASLPTYTFNQYSKQGKYTVELQVQDTNGKVSSVFQTYLIAYKDDQAASITGESNGVKSTAKISLVDNGWGIKDDGVELVQNQGSGVKRYQLNNNEAVTLPHEQHAITVDAPLTADDLTVKAWDECGNISTQTFQTAKVSFKDDVHDPYYVLKNGKFGELPEGPKKEGELFQGWAKDDGTIVTPETTISQDVVLHPVYTTEKVTLTFNANGGKFAEDKTEVKIEVPKGSPVIDALLSGEKLPVYAGYNFANWTLNGAAVTTQTANSDLTLTANWTVGVYKLIFDANGGNLGKLKVKNLPFGANVLTATQKDELGNPYQGTYLPTYEGYKFAGWASDKNGTEINPSLTMPSSDYTVYAKWTKDTSKYIVSFDSAGGSRVNSKSYPSGQANYGKLNTPSRSGYDFAGWYDETNTVRQSDSPVYKQADHLLTAHWTARNDTQYKYEYYVKTDSGYIRRDDLTVTKTGTTDTECSVAQDDIKAIDGYWFNEALDQNVMKGTITGDGKMTLKLYYDRYFNVNASSKGHGTVSADNPVKEGSDASASWKAEDGYVVHRVMIDGVVRDDLLTETGYTWPSVNTHHDIYVEFVPNGSIDGNDPMIGQNDFFQVKTRVDGVAGSCDITPTQTVKKGTDHTVTWKVNEGYFITSVLVDGKEYDIQAGKVDFTAVNSNHEVIVKVGSYPANGGGTTDGYYTITVNRYGGNAADTTVSNSFVVNPGESKDVTWKAQGGYHVSRVVVDGHALSADEIAKNAYRFENISANHVVDIYFQKDGGNAGDWGKDMVSVTTQLIGGPGSITAGAVLNAGSQYTVAWQPTLQTGNGPQDPNYGVYEIDRILVNDTPIDNSETQIVFNDLKENQDVRVYMRPVTYQVNVMKYGNGTVSASKTLFKDQSYLNILGTPDAASKVVKLVVDDQEVSVTGAYDVPAGVEVVQASETGVNLNVKNIADDHKIVVYFAEDAGQLPGADALVDVTGEIIGGTGTITGEGVFVKGEGTQLGWTLDQGYVVTDVKVNGVSHPFTGDFIDLIDLQENTHVEIFVTAKADKDNELPENGGGHNDNTDSLFQIETEIIGGPGEITNSTTVRKDSTHKVEWNISEKGYVIRDVIVDGISRPDLISKDGKGNVSFENIAENHKVVVIVGKAADVNIDVDGDGIPDVNIDTDKDGLPDINVDLNGDRVPDVNIDTDNTGTWKPSGQGGNGDAIWKPDTKLDTDGDGIVDVENGFRPGYDIDKDGVDDSWHPGKDVYPDGLANPGYDTSNPNIDIDTNGDGKPDINIDTDKDGKPDVNIDVDKDGTPDINIDTDKDGKPDVNIDVDKDGTPDINIDTDKDGKPDVNIDVDKDGTPDINIDTDKDGKPDVNIDVDKDGEPDINIDTDKDGKPDVNIDTDKDGKPDVNIDVDKDGEPDINIDTDKDGEPNVNIDTDKDGTPDVNIDVDKDGEPDINIDTDKDGKPDVNIDTDKDGKPDLNVDIDGDGKPDLNIDTNGDGKADVNIDTNGDGKPDLNQDIDGDGKPDLNIDTNGDGVADKNIDANGDGVIDFTDGPANTGDSMMMPVWFMLLAVSVCGCALLVLTKKHSAK